MREIWFLFTFPKKTKNEILNVLISSTLAPYWMSFGAISQGHSIPRSLEIVVQDNKL